MLSTQVRRPWAAGRRVAGTFAGGPRDENPDAQSEYRELADEAAGTGEDRRPVLDPEHAGHPRRMGRRRRDARGNRAGDEHGAVRRAARTPGERPCDTAEAVESGGSVYFDHGALRTVRWPHTGALPPGEAAFTRILRPLGFRLNGRYPLDKLGMTGRAYAHEDAPDEIAQFFVSELHPERFSKEFQQAVTNVVSTSRDPLSPAAVALLGSRARRLAAAGGRACAAAGDRRRVRTPARLAERTRLRDAAARIGGNGVDRDRRQCVQPRDRPRRRRVQAVRRREGEGPADEAGSRALALGPRVPDRVSRGYRRTRIPHARRRHGEAQRAGFVLRVHHAQAHVRPWRAAG